MKNKDAKRFFLPLLFISGYASAITLQEDPTGDYVKLYGEVGVGGHLKPDYEYGEFYSDQNFIDDSFATMGIKGKNDKMLYRLELDYERENWRGGSGDMVLAIDKLYVGYKIDRYNYIEAGLTDTAFDDYDAYGDFTFDTTVETGEAGDQDVTAKYEGKYSFLKAGISYTDKGESSSGSLLGDIVSGYVGVFFDKFSVVLGGEARTGSEGQSSRGEQTLIGLGLRYEPFKDIHIGLNGYFEEEDIAQDSTVIDVTDPNDTVSVYRDFQTLENEGALISAKYVFNPQWEVVGSANYEAFEVWDKDSEFWGGTEYSWGKERTWGTLGVNYMPTSSTIIVVEGNFGESAQQAYLFARVYF